MLKEVSDVPFVPQESLDSPEIMGMSLKNQQPQVKKDLEMCNACFWGKHWIVELRNFRSTHPKWLVKDQNSVKSEAENDL